MNDKFYPVIIVIAVLFIVIGGYLIVTNPFYGNDEGVLPLKSQDFKIFEIDLPEDSNFTLKNENDGMRYYQNSGKYSGNISGIIISSDMSDSLVGSSQLVSNTSSGEIYSFILKNETNYRFVFTQKDIDVMLIGNDLNLLKEISDTVRIKNTTGF